MTTPSLMTTTLSHDVNTAGRRCATVSTVASRKASAIAASTNFAVDTSIWTFTPKAFETVGGRCINADRVEARANLKGHASKLRIIFVPNFAHTWCATSKPCDDYCLAHADLR